MEPKGRLARWVMGLQEFQFSIEHRPGRRHANADALSRLVATATHTATTHAASTQTTQTTQPESKRRLDFNAVSAVQEAPRVLPTLNLSVYYATLTVILFVLNLVKAGGSAFLSKAQRFQTTAKHFLPRFLSLFGSACVPQPTVANESSAVTLNPRMDLKEAQKQDPVLSKLILFKSENRCRPEFSEWAGDPMLCRFWYQYDRLFLRDNILMRSVRKDSPIPRYAVVVPESFVPEVLRGIHDSPFAGHLGVTRTLDRIRERFYWPGMRESVEPHIRECSACAQGKDAPNTNKAPLRSIEVGEPFSFWAMDLMGPFPETARGNRHISVVMDHFTKWCEAIPTKEQKASTVAPILVNRIFSRFGPPAVLHSDQGANFKSNLMHHICDVMGITKTRTTAYPPSGDGQVERQNCTLQGMLSAFVSKHTDDWEFG